MQLAVLLLSYKSVNTVVGWFTQISDIFLSDMLLYLTAIMALITQQNKTLEKKKCFLYIIFADKQQLRSQVVITG